MLMEPLLEKFDRMHAENQSRTAEKDLLAMAISFNFCEEEQRSLNFTSFNDYARSQHLSFDLINSGVKVALELVLLPGFNSLNNAADPELYDLIFLTIHDGIRIVAGMAVSQRFSNPSEEAVFFMAAQVVNGQENITDIAPSLVNPALLNNYLAYMPVYLARHETETQHTITDNHAYDVFVAPDHADLEDDEQPEGLVGEGEGVEAEEESDDGMPFESGAEDASGVAAENEPDSSGADSEEEVPFAFDVVFPELATAAPPAFPAAALAAETGAVTQALVPVAEVPALYTWQFVLAYNSLPPFYQAPALWVMGSVGDDTHDGEDGADDSSDEFEDGEPEVSVQPVSDLLQPGVFDGSWHFWPTL